MEKKKISTAKEKIDMPEKYARKVIQVLIDVGAWDMLVPEDTSYMLDNDFHDLNALLGDVEEKLLHPYGRMREEIVQQVWVVMKQFYDELSNKRKKK